MVEEYLSQPRDIGPGQNGVAQIGRTMHELTCLGVRCRV